MKKSSLKKIAAALAMSAVAVTASSVNAFAEANNGYSDEAIAASDVQPVATVTKEVITLDEAKANPGRTVNITISGGTDQKWASSGMHVYYDSRLTLANTPVGTPDVESGTATKYLSMNVKADPTASEQNMKGFFVATAGTGDFGLDGVYATFTLTLPADVKEGDVFPIDIFYKSNENAEDMFLDAQRAKGAMQGYFFTKGIYNAQTNPFSAPAEDVAKVSALADISKDADGYIAIEGGTPVVTTTTQAPVTTTTQAPVTTTTKAPVTTTTAPITTKAPVTSSVTQAPVTTSSDNGTGTDANASGTKTTTSTKKTTTTTKKNNSTTTTKKNTNSPKTGVAGVGVAAAGLAAAVATAFVLRKKED